MELRGDTLYFTGGNGRITAVALRTGAVRWARTTTLDGASGPAVSGDTLYFSTGTGRVLALDRRTGEELWHTGPRAGGALALPDRSPRVLAVGRALYVSAADNTLFALDSLNPSRGGTGSGAPKGAG
ncbi:PQQ-binding-like beta-propeller repeat protein [Streptomyces sp. NPDC051776]|uniref:outer membrane protein assembly factor BamB family protein n=1 Tax=Streptomyces sp. NPDC051776 TaxID=3155414 RepID=UPI00342967D5